MVHTTLSTYFDVNLATVSGDLFKSNDINCRKKCTQGAEFSPVYILASE